LLHENINYIYVGQQGNGCQELSTVGSRQKAASMEGNRATELNKLMLDHQILSLPRAGVIEYAPKLGS